MLEAWGEEETMKSSVGCLNQDSKEDFDGRIALGQGISTTNKK